MDQVEHIKRNNALISKTINEYIDIALHQCESPIERMFLSNILTLLFWSKYQINKEVNELFHYSFDFDFKLDVIWSHEIHEAYAHQKMRTLRFKQLPGDNFYRVEEIFIKNLQSISTKYIESGINSIAIETFEIFRIQPQYLLKANGKEHRLDFAIFYDLEEATVCRNVQKIAIELNGNEFHSSPKALTKDANKIRNLQVEGWKIIPFTGSEVHQMTSNQNTMDLFDLLRVIVKN